MAFTMASVTNSSVKYKGIVVALKIQDQISKLPYFLVCFVLSTVPIIFGAVHPIVFSLYTAIVLLGLGGYLCLAYPFPDQSGFSIFNVWLRPILLILVFSAFQTIPLPLSLLEVISPARAARVEMVNTLTQTVQNFAAISEHGLLGITSTILLLALFIYFCALKILLRQKGQFFRIVYLIIVFVGVGEALYGLFQFLSPRIGILWLPITGARAAHGTIIYKNQYASFLNMCWPLAVAGVVIHLQSLMQRDGRKSKSKKSLGERIRRMNEETKLAPLFILATGIMLLSVVFSLSRGGIIAMVLVMILLNFFLPMNRKLKVILLVGIFLFITAYGVLLGLDTVVARFDSIGQSGITRIDTYLASIPMLVDHVWTGIGSGSYSLLSPVYLKGLNSNLQWDHSHSEYLQLILDFGVPVGGFIVLWLIYATFFTGFKLYVLIHDTRQPVQGPLVIAAGAFCALVGLLVHGVADFGWRLPANLFYAVTLAALVSHGLTYRDRNVGGKK